MRYHTLLTLALSFTLSMGAYYAAQSDDIPVQHLEFDEHLIIAQPNETDETDDGDGENLDMMNAHWCDIWPDDEICANNEDEKEEEEGC